MHLTTILTVLFVSLLAPLTASSPTPSACAPNPLYLTESWRAQYVYNYLALASGNLSLVPYVYQDNMVLYQDRNPEPEGSLELGITNSTAYKGYVIHFRTGFSVYDVSLRYWLAEGYRINIHWQVNAVVGNSSLLPESPVQKGHKLSYNGTDTVFLNTTTGLAYEVDSFFNIIDYDYQLGLKTLNIAQIPGTYACPVELGGPSCPSY